MERTLAIIKPDATKKRIIGKIKSVLDQAYLEKFVEGVRWWNGSAFVAEPTMVAR